MNDTNDDSGSSQTAPPICWACRETLKPIQTKCTECDSWQNWRRYLVFSNTTLALIVALLSGLATLVTLSDRLTPRGVLVAVVDKQKSALPQGEMSYTVEIHNNSGFPIVLENTINCSISVNFLYWVFKTNLETPEIHYEFSGFFKSNKSANQIIIDNKFIVFESDYTGHFDIEYGQYGNVSILRPVARDIMHKMRNRKNKLNLPKTKSKFGTFAYRKKHEENCSLRYRTHDGNRKTVRFENWKFDRDFEDLLVNVFREPQ